MAVDTRTTVEDLDDRLTTVEFQVRGLTQFVQERFADMDQRFADMDKRFDTLESKIETLAGKIDLLIERSAPDS